MAIHDVECCEECAVHDEVVQSVRGMLPDDDDLYDLAELFKVFGDSTRIRILFVLFESEMCVCDIAQLLNMTQSAISHQLRILKQSQLVKSRRDGKSVFYSLADDHVYRIINQGFEHINDDNGLNECESGAICKEKNCRSRKANIKNL